MWDKCPAWRVETGRGAKGFVIAELQVAGENPGYEVRVALIMVNFISPAALPVNKRACRKKGIPI